MSSSEPRREEIERKFLVSGDDWRSDPEPQELVQGYLAIDDHCAVRVRTAGTSAWLTVKGRGQGIVRPEFEYEIPHEEGRWLLSLCGERVVEKRRHRVAHAGFVWEVDEFRGLNAGLIIAEVETRSLEEMAQATATRPPWASRDVSDDERLLNARLSQHPFSHWSTAERRALSGTSP